MDDKSQAEAAIRELLEEPTADRVLREQQQGLYRAWPYLRAKVFARLYKAAMEDSD